MIYARLAPMCGATDFVFRELCFEQGCDVAYTEMISAIGFLKAPQQKAAQELLRRGENEKKLIVQLFGKDPSVIAEAASKLEELHRFDGIDINMGCPVPKIVSAGEGSALLRTPELAFQILSETVRSVSLPVSIKIRTGWDNQHICVIEFVRMAEEAGVSEIAIHGRTRCQMYSGTANWELIQQAAESVKIPVIGNGDICTAEQAMFYSEKYHLSHIMIGRGALGNPWIFRAIKSVGENVSADEVLMDERLEMIRQHYDMMLQWKTEQTVVREMRKHIGWYLRGLRGASRVRELINQADTPDNVWSILTQYLNES